MNTHSKYLLIVFFMVFSGLVYAENISCFYVPKPTKDDPYAELTHFEACGNLSGDNFELTADHLDNLDFYESPVTVITKRGVFYVLPTGKTARVHKIDNGADPFEDGLARGIKEGKYGFINPSLDYVIEPKYDFSFPFFKSFSVVCLGCTISKIGEYHEVIGGKWWRINKSGEVVTPIKHTKAEIMGSGNK